MALLLLVLFLDYNWCFAEVFINTENGRHDKKLIQIMPDSLSFYFCNMWQINHKAILHTHTSSGVVVVVAVTCRIPLPVATPKQISLNILLYSCQYRSYTLTASLYIGAHLALKKPRDKTGCYWRHELWGKRTAQVTFPLTFIKSAWLVD